MFLDGGTGAWILDSTFAGGSEGNSCCAYLDGTDGLPRAGDGVFFDLTGDSRSLEADALVIEGTSLAVRVSGLAGDRAWLPLASRADQVFDLRVRGVWLLPFPTRMTLLPLGTLPGNGVLDALVTLPDLPPSELHRQHFAQAMLVETGGGPILSGSHALTILGREGTPDCNGNGVNDLVDLLEGTSTDADGDLLPDECDPDCNGNGIPDWQDIADGTSFDCNGNGVPDECEGYEDCNANGVPDLCDIADGTSLDLDLDGVPDECEDNATFYVDDDAAAGGDGSLQAPFRTIAEGLAMTRIGGDRVVVLDGVYSGPGNQDLELFGVDVILESQNGPGACVLDGLGSNRLFHLRGGETKAARISGFTVRDGSYGFGPNGGGMYIEESDVSVTDCVFEGCVGWWGGAVTVIGGSPHFSDCHFEGNQANSGGAAYVTDHAIFERCTFVRNDATAGGALMLIYDSRILVTHSRFLENTAQEGGAISHRAHLANPEAWLLRVDDCLFAGNQSQGRGGAILVNTVLANDVASSLITGSTFSHNAAAGSGGAIALTCSSNTRIHNSVLYGNSAPVGAELTLERGVSFCLDPVAAVHHCDVAGGQAAVHVEAGSTLDWGASNLDLDPLFVDSDGADDDPATTFDNDYRLAPTSPCIDAADNTSVPQDFADVDEDGVGNEPVPLDLGLLPRFVDDPFTTDTGVGDPPVVDMGAHEFQG